MLLFLVLLTAVNAQKQYVIKSIYFKPADREARDNWQVKVGQIMEHTQSWFRREFGRTFEFTDPIMIELPETEQELRTYEVEEGDAEERDRIGIYLNNYVQDTYREEYFEQGVYFAMFIEVDLWVAKGGNGMAIHGGIEMDNYEEFAKLTIIPFHHEFYHMFGGHHTQETIDCLNAANPDLNLVWTKTFMNPVLTYFEPGFDVEEYQRNLLLDPNYYPECLLAIDQNYFDHPSNFLKCMNNPDLNGDGLVNIDDLAEILVNWGDCINTYCPADINCDGSVNLDDLATVLVNYRTMEQQMKQFHTHYGDQTWNV